MSKAKPFYLVETTTPDKLIHQGIFYKPKKAEKRALLWVHGLGGNFYSHIELWECFAKECEKTGLGFAAFHNRGHHLISGIRKQDKRKPTGYGHENGGAGYEDFKDAIFDIEAGIDFLVGHGFPEIVVIGHSTGANKVCYFATKKQNPHVIGVILASPLSDRLGITNKYKLEKDLVDMQELVNKGKGDELVIGYKYYPITPKRFLSLFSANSLEDQFDYGDPRPRMTYFSKIKKPVLILLGSANEYLDRAATKVKEVFDEYSHSQNYQFIILPNAFHSFNGQEKEVTQKIVDWTKSL